MLENGNTFVLIWVVVKKKTYHTYATIDLADVNKEVIRNGRRYHAHFQSDIVIQQVLHQPNNLKSYLGNSRRFVDVSHAWNGPTVCLGMQ